MDTSDAVETIATQFGESPNFVRGLILKGWGECQGENPRDVSVVCREVIEELERRVVERTLREMANSTGMPFEHLEAYLLNPSVPGRPPNAELFVKDLASHVLGPHLQPPPKQGENES